MFENVVVMSEEYLVRSYQQGDEMQLVQLLELVFSGWPRFDLNCTPLDHWKWKYQENPINEKIIVVAEKNGRVIGCSHGTSEKLKINDNSISAAQGTDLAVHPDFRGKGLSKKIIEYKNVLHSKLNVNIFYGLTANLIMKKSSLSMGRINFPYRITDLVIINDINLFLKSKQLKNSSLYKYGYILANIYNNIKNLFKFQKEIDNAFDISIINDFDDRINVFWDGIKDHYDFIIERNKKYLNWRYCDPRGGNYVIKIAEDNDVILGYSVVRINRYFEDCQEGYIVDVLALPNRLDVANALILDATHFLNNQNVSIIRSWVVENHPYKELFHQNGYLNSRFKPTMHIQSVGMTPELGNIFQIRKSRSFLQYGDSDWI